MSKAGVEECLGLHGVAEIVQERSGSGVTTLPGQDDSAGADAGDESYVGIGGGRRAQPDRIEVVE